MRKRRVHTHPCAVCRVLFSCPGELEQNYDGWPEVVCDLYDVDGSRIFRLCEDCTAKGTAAYARDMAEQEADA